MWRGRGLYAAGLRSFDILVFALKIPRCCRELWQPIPYRIASALICLRQSFAKGFQDWPRAWLTRRVACASEMFEHKRRVNREPARLGTGANLRASCRGICIYTRGSFERPPVARLTVLRARRLAAGWRASTDGDVNVNDEDIEEALGGVRDTTA